MGASPQKRASESLSARQPLAIQKKYLANDLRAAKRDLRQAVKQGDVEGASHSVKRLIALRADQTALALRELEEIYGKVEDEVLEIYAKQYAADCVKLIRAIGTRF